MKFTTLLSKFRDALETAGKAVAGPHTTLPVLQTVLLETRMGMETVTVKATNLEIGITTSFTAEVEKAGSVAIPYRPLVDYISNLGESDITVSLNEKTQTVTLESGRFKGNIKSIEYSEFPVIQEPVGEQELHLKNGELFSALTRTAISAATDGSRPTLETVFFHVQKGNLTLASADGFRLSVVNSLKVDVKDGKFLVPIANVSKILKLASKIPDDYDVRILVNPNNVHFVWDFLGLQVFSTLVEGNFPDYTQIVPKEGSFQTHITVGRKALETALALSSVFARESSNIVRFTAKDGGFSVAAMSAETGDSDAVMESQVGGADVEFALNGKFVKDFVGVVNGDEVVFHVTSPSSPVQMNEVGNSNFTAILMPMSLGR